MLILYFQGGQQEDAEEFLGFFLDTLEEELLSISSSLMTEPKPKAPGGPSAEGSADDGWLEVGKKNKAVVTRSVRTLIFVFWIAFLIRSRLYLQTKSANSPITRIFGGKFRSTLKVPGQRDSALLEDWRAIQLDIQVCNPGSEQSSRYI